MADSLESFEETMTGAGDGEAAPAARTAVAQRAPKIRAS